MRKATLLSQSEFAQNPGCDTILSNVGADRASGFGSTLRSHSKPAFLPQVFSCCRKVGPLLSSLFRGLAKGLYLGFGCGHISLTFISFRSVSLFLPCRVLEVVNEAIYVHNDKKKKQGCYIVCRGPSYEWWAYLSVLLFVLLPYPPVAASKSTFCFTIFQNI